MSRSIARVIARRSSRRSRSACSGTVAMLLDVAVRLGADPRARRGVRDLEAEATVGEGEDVRSRRPAPPRVRDDDDLELEALGRVDREQSNRVGALLLRDGVRLLRADRLLAGDEPYEPLEVGAPELFVRSRETRELAEVRVAPVPIAPGENREVVVVLGDDPLAEELERNGRGDLEPTARSAAGTRGAAADLLREGRQAAAARGPGRPAGAALLPGSGRARRSSADEGRRQHREECLVVVAVVQKAQVREQIDDLLLPE